MDTFFLGFTPNVPAIKLTACSLLLATLWFFAYFQFIYQTDCEADGDMDTAVDEDPQQLSARARSRSRWLNDSKFLTPSQQPDLILVFPHLNKQGDKAKFQRSQSIVETRSTDDKPEHDSLVGEILQEQVVRHVCVLPDPEKSPRSTQQNLKFKYLQKVIEDDLTPESLDRWPVVDAILRDLHEKIPDLGFHDDYFQSIDKDEIFVGISVENETVMEKYLHTQHADVQIRSDVLKNLGIGECCDEAASSPPYIPYDPFTVEQLHAQKVLEENNALDFYRKHDGRFILNFRERFRLIYRILSKSINLDSAVRHKLLVSWYPAHRMDKIQALAEKWKTFETRIDFSFKQPIHQINQYFGARVSFLFLFNGVYCKALLALVPIAILLQSLGQVATLALPGSDESRQVMGMTMIVLIWARIAGNLHNREQDFFLECMPDRKDRIIRPEFRGEYIKAEHDANVMELEQPGLQKFGKTLVSVFVTFLSIMCVVGTIVVWLSIFDGDLSLGPTVCISIMIKVSEIIFNKIADVLTDWENLKYAEDYYNSYLLKQFSFGAVNNYWFFFYIALKQRYTHTGCPARGCLVLMREQLTIALIVLCVLSICQVAGQSLVVRWTIHQEDKALRKIEEEKAKALGRDFSGELPKRSYAEEQSKYDEFNAKKHVQAMMQLVISLGYVIFFGGVVPITIPCCFAVFVVSLRANAFALLTCTKRPLPFNSHGIGKWQEVVTAVVRVGVLFAAFLLAIYGNMLKGQQTITKVCVAAVFCFVVVGCWVAVDIFVPSSLHTVVIMKSRRERVLQKIMETIEKATGHDKDFDQGGIKLTRKSTVSSQAVRSGEWHKIKGAANAADDIAARKPETLG